MTETCKCELGKRSVSLLKVCKLRFFVLRFRSDKENSGPCSKKQANDSSIEVSRHFEGESVVQKYIPASQSSDTTLTGPISAYGDTSLPSFNFSSPPKSRKPIYTSTPNDKSLLQSVVDKFSQLQVSEIACPTP